MTCRSCGHNRSQHRHDWNPFHEEWDTGCSHTEYGMSGRDRCPCPAFEGNDPVTELHDAAKRAGVFQYIAKRAGELLANAKQELRALPNGDTVAGRHNDQVLCKASWVKGRQTIVVDDAAALLEWVKANHPTEIVESVNTAFVSTFKAVDGIVIDGAGEPVPGMRVKQGDPYITVKGNAETPFLVAQLLRGGHVSIDGVREVEP